MTEAQIDFILKATDYYGSTVEELTAVFPDVDWVAAGERRSAARQEYYASLPRSEHDGLGFVVVTELLYESYAKTIREMMERPHPFFGRIKN